MVRPIVIALLYWVISFSSLATAQNEPGSPEGIEIVIGNLSDIREAPHWLAATEWVALGDRNLHLVCSASSEI